MTLEIQTRAATQNDLPQIVELKIAMLEEAGFLNLYVSNPYETVLNDYTQLYQSKLALHFVAEKDHVLVSMTGAFIKSDIPFYYFKTPNYGFIGDVYTKQAYRKQGLAKTLSESAIAWLKSQQIEMIRLLASDAGRSLYESLGFKASDEMILWTNQQK